jgi:hypothetical protein
MAYCPCWERCDGKPSKDGNISCSVDGGLRPCRALPVLDENGNAVICEHGPGPIPYNSIDL